MYYIEWKVEKHFNLNSNAERYWSEFVIPYINEDEITAPKLKKGDAERVILSLVNEALDEGDIVSGKMKADNLIKFNMANIIAIKIFKNIKNIEFETSTNNWSFATTTLCCEDLIVEDVENCKSIKKDDFAKFMDIIDFFNITIGSDRLLRITFTVNNVFEEIN